MFTYWMYIVCVKQIPWRYDIQSYHFILLVWIGTLADTRTDSKVDNEIFLGYSDTSKAYKVLNSRTLVVEVSIHIKFFDELKSNKKLSYLNDDFLDMQIGPSNVSKGDKVSSRMNIFLKLKNHHINHLRRRIGNLFIIIHNHWRSD